MAFNGSGVYNPPAAPTFPAVPNTTIESSKFNDIITDIAAQGLTKCITRDGQSPATANLPMAGFRHTGVGNAVSATDYAAFGQVPGVKGLIGATDWDNFILIGVYEAEAVALTAPATNFPPTSDIGQLVVLAQGSVIVQQYTTANNLFTRVKVSSTWTDWTLSANVISTNTTLNVPADFATLADVYDYLQTKVIAGDATVTIKLADGTHNVAAGFSLAHPNGSRLKIEGNLATPSNVIVQFNGTATQHILTLSGSELQSLDGMLIRSLNVSATGNKGCIFLEKGASITLGDNVLTSNMSNGLRLESGSKAFVGASTITANATDIYVTQNSFVRFIGTVAGTGATTGLLLEESSIAVATNLTIDGMDQTGARVIEGSTLVTSASTYSNSVANEGIACQSGSLIVFLAGNTVSGNNTFGISYSFGSNSVGSFTGGSNGSGDRQAVVDVNSGSSTAIIGTSTGELFLNPAGGANVKFGTHSALAAETVTGYITITDAGGTLRKLAVVS